MQRCCLPLATLAIAVALSSTNTGHGQAPATGPVPSAIEHVESDKEPANATRRTVFWLEEKSTDGSDKDQGHPVRARAIVVQTTPDHPQSDRMLPKHLAILGLAEGKQFAHAKPPEFWLGIVGTPVTEALKSQLGIEYGVVVGHVADASPAKASGIQLHDIVLKIDETTVTNIIDFFEPLEKSKGNAIVMHIMRKGKPKTIAVTPAKRPDHATPWTRSMTTEPLPAPSELLNLQPHGSDIDITVVRPGIVLSEQLSDLPEGVVIRITKSAKQPATIEVTRGDETWKATEENIEDLPDFAQGWLKDQFEGPGALRLEFTNPLRRHKRAKHLDVAPVDGDHPAHDPASWPNASETSTVERRLDELSKQLEQMREALEELRSAE